VRPTCSEELLLATWPTGRMTLTKRSDDVTQFAGKTFADVDVQAGSQQRFQRTEVVTRDGELLLATEGI